MSNTPGQDSKQTPFKDAAYLVLGGNGFIGSHIVDKLAENGVTDIRVLDSFERPAQFKETAATTKIIGSAFDSKTLQKALQDITYVVHSLGATNPFTADANPYADIENLQRSVEIFEQCAQADVRKIAFISSGGAVYGSLAEKKSANEVDIAMPVSPYGICKLATEHYLEYFKRKYGTEYVVYRLSNPYGPRQPFKKEHGVIPAFAHAILQDKEITVLGDGSASRDYIYIEDAATMIAKSISMENKQPVYNIGSGQQTTVSQIIEALENIFGKIAMTKHAEAPKTTLQKTSISIEAFLGEFELSPSTDFHDGLAKTIKALASHELVQST